MMAEGPVFSIPVPRGKKSKMKAVNTAMVLNSLVPTLPIVMPDSTAHLQDSKSAPNSPDRSHDRKKGFFQKHLPRPKSPHRPHRTSSSDPESGSPSPQARPRWLPFKGKKRKSAELNGDAVPAAAMLEGMGTSSESPEATPVDQLPGRALESSNSGSNLVPEIRVSSEAHDYLEGESVSFEEISGSLDPYRKNSQSSRCSSGSGLMSVGTSGIGSCLSPSGDESSDLESPLSPSSVASSFTEERTTDSDVDPIDKDYPTWKGGSGSADNLSVTTPTPTSESPPNALDMSSITLVAPPSPTDEKSSASKKRRERNVWMKVRNAVKAWSPFKVQFKKKTYPWVQLAGHEGNFMPGGEHGTIMKKSGENERHALRQLLNDSLRNFVPEFKREVDHNGEVYVEMTDLLREFNEPAVMDIKMGIRTYLEEELGKKKTLRKDMYLKMIDIDPNEPTAEEREQEAITKPRYMLWRESLSSSSTLGFRIEGIKTSSGKALKDFKRCRERDDVREALQTYLAEHPAVKEHFLKRLMDVRTALEASVFFTANELIGSSLLFVYDDSGLCSINMIDFGKTTPLPEGVSITHVKEWVDGNHEDGYLYGLDNLIDLWKEL